MHVTSSIAAKNRRNGTRVRWIIIPAPEMNGWHLQLVDRPGEVIHAVKQRMFNREIDPVSSGQHTVHLILKIVPITFTPKIVGHESSASHQEFAQSHDLL